MRQDLDFLYESIFGDPCKFHPEKINTESATPVSKTPITPVNFSIENQFSPKKTVWSFGSTGEQAAT